MQQIMLKYSQLSSVSRHHLQTRLIDLFGCYFCCYFFYFDIFTFNFHLSHHLTCMADCHPIITNDRQVIIIYDQ